LPGIAIQSICVDLLGILKEILSYGIGGLYARHNPVYNVFLHEPFFVDSLNRAVLEQNRSIKTVLETFLCHFIGNVNYLAWPDPSRIAFFRHLASDFCLLGSRLIELIKLIELIVPVKSASLIFKKYLTG
jgi:hypothetical protein